METLEGSLMDSCNDALMQMSYLIGADNFTEFQSIFGFGMKTGIDLPGEASTATLVYTADNITKVDLATNSFGQNYNCTMVQMASAFSSLINGGTYYQPHIVTKITDSDGNIIESIEPTVLKQTVSEGTSSLIKDYLYSVVSSGTGKTAKVDGYSMGGKTGTAQMYDEETHKRKEGSYLVSFLGFAPYDDPQLVIYCIVDQPNTDEQDHSTYAQNIVREILKEVLPYMNIYPDEELTGLNENLTISGSEVIVSQTTSSDDTGAGSDDTSPDDTGTGSDDTAGDTVEAQ
jgi:stage V sporulation protein D (sporulation-specific penicillin-binding protein)